MRNILILFVLILWVPAFAQNDTINYKKEYYPGGEIKNETQYKENKADGASISYFTNGNISTISFFRNGRNLNYDLKFTENIKAIITKTYYPDGKVKSYRYSGATDYGKSHLFIKDYYDNGNLFRMSFLKDGISPVGVEEYYYQNGTIAYQLEWPGVTENNKHIRNGVWKQYAESGLLKAELIYENNTLIKGQEIKYPPMYMPRKPVDTNAVYLAVERAPEYVTAAFGLDQYLKEKITASGLKENGTVVVEFIVDRDGSVIQPKIKQSLSPAADNLALQMVSTMPKWNPGKQGGVNLKVQYVLPIVFQ